MQSRALSNLFLCVAFGVALPLFLSACGGSSERLDRREERDPLIIRGDARKKAGDSEGAIEFYLQALDRNPQMAMAHLKLGLEYRDQQKEYLRAIFHINRYMELRPNAEKNELLEQLVRRSHVQYLASMPNPPPGAIEQIALLEDETERLRRQVEELTAQLRALDQQTGAEQRSERQTAPQPRRPSAAAPEEAQSTAAVRESSAPRTYRVQRGDTLSRVAARMYDDSTQWRKIYEANRGLLATPNSLREGQELMIP